MNKRALDAELFPHLSKRMANMQNGSVKMPASTTEVISNLITDKEYQMHNGNGDYNHANGKSVIVTTVPGIHTNHEHGMHLISDHEMDAIETQRNVERIARDWGVDSIDDVNAATAMLALKHGPKIFSETFQTGYVLNGICMRLTNGIIYLIKMWLYSFSTPIITTKPSEDHTYSAGGGAKQGNTVSTIVNITTTNGTENNVHFNGNNLPPTAPHQVQIKHESTNLMNNSHEIIIDNRHSDNVSNGTSSGSAYESSEER